MKESRKKLLKGIVTAAAAAGAVYGMNRLVFPVNDEGFVDIKRKVLL